MSGAHRGARSGGAGLGYAGLEGGELGRALALAQIGEAGLRGAEAFGGLAEGGEFGALLKAEDLGPGVDARALLHGEALKASGEGSGEMDEFALEVALPGGGGAGAAAGEGEREGGEGEEDGFSGGKVFHVPCDRRG